LKDDLDALSASGDQLEKEDQQITSDIKMLRLLVAQEAAKKAEMQKQLESLQKQRRDAEDKIAEQIKEIAQLDEDLNLLHGNALLIKRMETDYAQAYERESGGGMT
jgi:chromosome segregation ATPase